MTTENQHSLVIERTFKAPRQLVWDVWTKAEHITNWFGPEGLTTRVELQEFWVGGKTRYVMITPDGTEYPAEGVYLEIVPIEKIVSTDEFGEDFVAAVDTKLPKILSVTYEFTDLGSTTGFKLTLKHPTAEDMILHKEMGVEAGWNSSFDKMDNYLATLV